MTCAHVRGLIDAGPFAGYPPAHFDAARRHARACGTCGQAMAAAAALAADLAGLPQPAPPPDLAAAVMARIERMDEAHTTAVASMPGTAPRHAAGDWPAWATTIGGLAVGLAVYWAPPGGATASGNWMTISLTAMPSTSAWALVLAAGLVLYVAGLFAPLGGSNRH